MEINSPEYHQELFNTTLSNINLAEQRGILDAVSAKEYRLQAHTDLNERIPPEDINFNESMLNIAEFTATATNAFGHSLGSLIEEEYEDSEEGVLALSEITGYEPEAILALVTGEVIPDAELVDQLASAFEATSEDEDAYIGFQTLALEARNDLAESEDEIEYLDDLFEISDDYEDEFEAEYDEDMGDEEFDDEDEYVLVEDDETAQYRSELMEVQNQLAEFQVQQAVKDQLDELVQHAEDMVEARLMFPVEFDALFGDLPDALDRDKIGLFAAATESNDMDIDTHLMCIQYALKVLGSRGEIFPNGQLSHESPELYEEAEFSDSLEEQARRNMELYKEQGFLN
jgi:hypothetical protein